MDALLLVDIQNDFMPGGSLPVPEGDRILPLVQEIVHYPFDIIIATKDWHPIDHRSFAVNHNQKPGSHIQLAGLDQILWPSHCVQGTIGADFSHGWDTTCIDKVVYKGTDPFIDSYSAFFDNGHRKSTELELFLKEKGIKKLFFAGLATDYCVKYSVLDALRLGFKSYVIMESCRGINLHPHDIENSLVEMNQAGAILISFSDLKNLLDQGKELE
jgi:nicotinamidase/pyrazinamidase